MAIPSPDNMREAMRRLSARPHHVGSAYGKENAEWILARFREWGWDARIETFDVLFPTPKERLVEMVGPTRFKLALDEPALAVDPTSGQKAEQLPTYNAYSTDGDVTGPLVYVNYGLPEDYDELDRMGISVKGAIVLARYGHSWRGIKPKVAAEHGAVGCLIYSDPRDDGYFGGDVFPKGPMRPRDGVQRGSVMDFPSSNPGDPLTPGVGATPEAKRLSVEDAPSLTRIPVLPISYGDAQPLLAALEGPLAPEAWRGALPVPYHVGPGPTKVHLKLAFNWDLRPVHDVVARIPGAERPDEWVVRGNHHDAWVNGAEDPVAGMVALLEEARALGVLLKEGWKPKRTIVYCAWDGEEPMLLGSTEWAEAHADELRQKAVAYVNTDGNGRGYLGMSGSHTLEHLMNDVARDVPDPEAKVPVWKRAQARALLDASSAEERKEIRQRADLRLGALGSGSDYTAFIDHLGVASLNLGLRRRGRGRDLPLDLRRLLLVHALLRHRLRVRPGARPDGRPCGPASRGRRSPALRVRRLRGHDAGVREGPEDARRAEAGRDRRAQPSGRRTASSRRRTTRGARRSRRRSRTSRRTSTSPRSRTRSRCSSAAPFATGRRGPRRRAMRSRPTSSPASTRCSSAASASCSRPRASRAGRGSSTCSTRRASTPATVRRRCRGRARRSS